MRQRLKRFPILVRMKKAWDALLSDPHAADRRTIKRLRAFAPNSAGAPDAVLRLTFLSVNQTFPFLLHLLDQAGKGKSVAVTPSEGFLADQKSKESADVLKRLLDQYGSDKSNFHDYHHVYGRILRDPDSVTALLEIGIGSHHEDVVSNMGEAGKPGASLRAFRDYLPKATIYGADVDRRILFQEDRVKTFFVDQTDLASLEALGEQVGNDFDLIIDDGLHSPNANIAVLAFALTRLKPGGWVVVEDIIGDALPIWQVVASLLPPEFEPHLISAQGALVFAVRRLPTDGT
jgi:SAM-dependent methyltransferase